MKIMVSSPVMRGPAFSRVLLLAFLLPLCRVQALACDAFPGDVPCNPPTSSPGAGSDAGDEGTTLGQAGTDALPRVMLPVMAMHDIAGDRWVLEVAPGWWRTQSEMNTEKCRYTCGGDRTLGVKPSGYALAVGLKRELSNRTGVSLLLGLARHSGEESLGSHEIGLAPDAAMTGTPGGVGFPGGSLKDVSGFAVAATYTYDFYPNPEGFRLPVFIGPFWGRQGFRFSHSLTNPNNGRWQTETVDFSRSVAGAAFGFSLDFLLLQKKLRVTPGMFALWGLGVDTSPSYDYVVTQAGTTTRYRGTMSGVNANPGTFYVQALYRPLGLTLSTNLYPSEAQAFSLKWTRKW